MTKNNNFLTNLFIKNKAFDRPLNIAIPIAIIAYFLWAEFLFKGEEFVSEGALRFCMLFLLGFYIWALISCNIYKLILLKTKRLKTVEKQDHQKW